MPYIISVNRSVLNEYFLKHEVVALETLKLFISGRLGKSSRSSTKLLGVHKSEARGLEPFSALSREPGVQASRKLRLLQFGNKSSHLQNNCLTNNSTKQYDLLQTTSTSYNCSDR